MYKLITLDYIFVTAYNRGRSKHAMWSCASWVYWSQGSCQGEFYTLSHLCVFLVTVQRWHILHKHIFTWVCMFTVSAVHWWRNRACKKRSYKFAVLELFSNSMWLLVEDCFAYKFFHVQKAFGKLLVHSWRWCGGLNEEHSMWVHCGSNSYWRTKRC